jgi:hypothetical protein
VFQEFAQNLILNEGIQVLADYTERLRPAPAPAR